jgi:NADPH:quinone reductase-like Zn-dependent oxidoreductase
MRAIVQNDYGSSDVFALKEIDKPIVKDNDVLVRVCAAALHAGDCFTMRGVPYPVRVFAGWPKPKDYVPGFDVAGYVEGAGRNVKGLQLGDEVFGACSRSCAEYVCGRESDLLPKPSNLTLEQAAAVPTSALTALRGLRDAGKIRPGQSVLINGASGGVGTFAVQIAKAFGAEVTGVCSTRNGDMVRAIGADHVIDYTQEDFTQNRRRYDLILDNVGSRSFSDLRHALAPKGVIVPNSGHAGMGYVLKALVLSMFSRRHGRPFVSVPKIGDLAVLRELIEVGKLKPAIDRTYPLSRAPEAFRYLDEGHARGKVVITVEHDSERR